MPASLDRPGGRSRFERLEALRGLAALYVVLHHTIPHRLPIGGMDFGFLLRFGQEAVILFFLLSGFVIHHSFSHARDRSFRTYFLKRAIRIYVPFVTVLIASYLVASLTAARWVDPELPELAGNLLMLQDWSWSKPNVIVDGYLGNGPLWSLAYEWWFYMLYWPLQTFVRGRKARDRLVLGLAVAATVLYVVWPTFVPRILAYFGIWWCGAMLAEARLRGELDRWKTYALPLAVLVAASAVLAVGVLLNRDTDVPLLLGRHPLVELRHFGFAAFAFTVAALWHRGRWQGFDTLTRPFLMFAPISYALYISHLFLIADAEYLDFLGNPVVELAGYAGVTLAFCWSVEIVLYPAVRRRILSA